MTDKFKVEHGLGRCSVMLCHQMVQDRTELSKKRMFCYAHAKMRDKLFARPCDYRPHEGGSRPQLEWDLEVG